MNVNTLTYAAMRVTQQRPHTPDLGVEPPEWTEIALCLQVDPEIFFVEKGGSTAPAKLICGRCEVRDQCLTEALLNNERFGVWGGLSERERRRLTRPGVA